MRPLPRSLDPLPGESLPGYLLRLAHRLDLTPAELGRFLGLAPASRYDCLRRQILLGISDDALASFTCMTRLSPSEARGLTLADRRDHYPPISQSLPKAGAPRPQIDGWLFSGFSRCCPRCLSDGDSPLWKKEWHLPVVFACTRHERFLRYQCADCRMPPHHHVPSVLIPRAGIRGLHPAQCRQQSSPGYGSICGARLDRQPLRILRPSPQLLTLQRHINGLLDQHHPRKETAEYFTDIRLMTALIIASWPSAKDRIAPRLGAAVDREVRARRAHRARGGHYVRDTAPTDPIACGALISAADSLLKTEDLGSTLTPLFERTFESLVARESLIRVFSKHQAGCSHRTRTTTIPLIRTIRRAKRSG